MPVAVITADYDGYAIWDILYGLWLKNDSLDNCKVGRYQDVGYDQLCRTFLRFPLASLPLGVVSVDQVRLKVFCLVAGGPSHLTDVHAYDTNGQSDPQPDAAQTCYNRCASGNLYIDDSPDLRTTGEKWFNLGAQACADVLAAKAAVNRFSLGLHEEGDYDPWASIIALECLIPYYAQLEITYTVPVVGYRYGNGLVVVQT